MPITEFTTLSCIVVDNLLNVLIKPFQLTVPVDHPCELLLLHLRIAVPSLRSLDLQKFSLHKPKARIRLGTDNVTASQVDLSDSVNIKNQVRTHFSTEDPNFVKAIVCVNDATGGVKTSDLTNSKVGPIPLLVIKLETAEEMSNLNDECVSRNDVFQARQAGEEPPCIVEFEQSILKPRYPELENKHSPLIQLVKTSLQDLGENYDNYFTSTSPESSSAPTVGLLEFFHYSEVFLDTQIVDGSTYRLGKEHHMNSLLRRLLAFEAGGVDFYFNKPWPIRLVLQVGGNWYQYTPRSDFSIVIANFPVLLIEVNSKTNECDLRRMILQASCLVRLGNAMTSSSLPGYFVIGIYVDNEYRAFEYKFYQKTHHDPDVYYSTKMYDLTKARDMFIFVFRLYGFLRSIPSLRSSLSMDFQRFFSTIQIITKQMPHLGPGATRSESGSSKVQTRGSAASKVVFPALPMLALEHIKEKGYVLSEEPQKWPENIAKATKDGLVRSLKLLDRKTEERNILERLQRPAHDNHVVELLEVISFDGVNCDIIVMPWLSSLGDRSREPSVWESLATQFLEGVSFLHNSKIAHLDLKPGNVLVDDTQATPQLAIIDFGVSTCVDNEDTNVTGFRGTPSWTAPEVGNPDGLVMTYSAIRADRWSCGRMLEHFSRTFPLTTTSFSHISTQLLNLDPKRRPSLAKILEILLSSKKGKHGIPKERYVPMKRTRTSNSAIKFRHRARSYLC